MVIYWCFVNLVSTINETTSSGSMLISRFTVVAEDLQRDSYAEASVADNSFNRRRFERGLHLSNNLLGRPRGAELWSVITADITGSSTLSTLLNQFLFLERTIDWLRCDCLHRTDILVQMYRMCVSRIFVWRVTLKSASEVMALHRSITKHNLSLWVPDWDAHNSNTYFRLRTKKYAFPTNIDNAKIMLKYLKINEKK